MTLTAPSASTTVRTQQDYRPDIDGLRALAVVAVVAYHAGIPGFGGGYVGVDVFFVISGFLITGLLIREVEQRGRLSVSGFYGRRARRLLPMAALVSVVTVAVGWWLLSPLAHHDLAADALATSTYTINLRLASQQLIYLRAGLAPSAFQQFWSLAVEEQFYLCWPLLMWLVMRGRSPRRSAAAVVAVLCAASLLLALAWVHPQPAWAFFSLPTRAWQLGVGALLALGWRRIDTRVPAAARRTAVVLGLAAIAISVVAFGESTPWPGGWALVPTIGTALVILGPGGDRGLVGRALSAPGPRWIGLRSYSWYLWHWPAMVFIAAALDRSIGGWPAVLMAVATLALAHVTFRRVEQPVRRSPRLVSSPRLSVSLGLAVTATLAVLFTALLVLPGDVVGPGAAARSVSERDLEAHALDAAALVQEVPRNLVPSLESVDSDAPRSYADGCHLSYGGNAPIVCGYGDLDARSRVVIFGDSHAAQWVPALDALGQRDHFLFIPFTKSGCPAATMRVYEGTLRRNYTECEEWRASVIEHLRRLQPDLIIVTNTDRYAPDATSGLADDASFVDGFVTTLRQTSAIAPTVLLADTPFPKRWIPWCLADHLTEASRCVLTRSELKDRHFESVEAEAARAAGVPFVPTIDLLCGNERCPVIVGNTMVYRDNSHMTPEYATEVGPQLARLLVDAVPDDNPLEPAPSG